MSIFARAPQSGQGAVAGARSVLRRLLETESVSGVIVDVAGKGNAIPHRRLVHQLEQIDRSLVFAPVMLRFGTDTSMHQSMGLPANRRLPSEQ